MRYLKSLFIVSVASIFFASCSVVMPVTATSNPVGSKVGTAKATAYLGVLFFNQDASIKRAAKKWRHYKNFHS